MSTYLIDFENVKSGGLAGIEHIRKEDSVHLFWSARENKITIEMMELIRSSESEIVMHKAVTGERDALDHQLCSYLGFLAGDRGENDFVIVSNDKAYDHLIEFWRKLNDQIHIQRVSEISRAAETVRAVEIVRAAETAAEAAQAHVDAAESEPVRTDRTEKAEKTDRSDKGPNEHTEASERQTPDSYGSRNSRRRERGSRYLKGGRTGRGSRKNNYTENYAEERPEEEKAADTVRETDSYQTETPVPAEPKKESAAAYVVTGIRTGILVESGFTADGILKKSEESPADSDRKNAVEKTAENTAENDTKQAAEYMPEAAAEKVPESDAEKAADQAVTKILESNAGKAADQAVKKVPEGDAEEVPDNIVREVPESEAGNITVHAAETEKVKVAEKAGKKTDEGTPGKTARTEIPAAEEMSAEKLPETVKVSESPAAEAVSDISGMKPVELSEMPELFEQEAESVKAEQPLKQTPRSRVSRTTTRAKRGRPSQKEHAEYFPEIRIPIIESDVIAKCEEAANAEWTGEVVRLINQSKDKKELYSAIVKLLGQEKGRTVYHAIKVLK